MEEVEQDHDLESAKEELGKVRRLITEKKRKLERAKRSVKPLESGVSLDNGTPIEKDKNGR